MTLGGVIFCYNAIKFDYCIVEAINCLKELVDELVVLDAGSDDGTQELLKQFEDQKTIAINLPKEEWFKYNGREKLSHFQNLALSFLSTDYYFLLQADEVIHEDSFPSIRAAIETGKDAFYCKRINLWRDCDSYINVPENRQPCSTHVIRLAKTNYLSVGDGESIEANASSNFINGITIVHYGFVRTKSVMKSKVVHMQEGVFQIVHDPKLDQTPQFEWSLWFNESELSPLEISHPKYIQDWIKTRP